MNNLETDTQLIFSSEELFAKEADSVDPLGSYRDRFHIPQKQ